MATSALLRFGCAFAAVSAILFAASGAAAQPKLDLSNLPKADVDFSKLVKNDPIEIKLGDQWVLGKFRSTPNGKVIYVRVDGVDHMAFPNMVRLPAGGKAAAPPKPRTWTDKSGKFKLQATLVRVDGDKVLLKRTTDGKEIAVAFDKLSDADHKYLKSVETAKDGAKGAAKAAPKSAPEPATPAPPASANP